MVWAFLRVTAALLALTIAVFHIAPRLGPGEYSQGLLFGTWLAMVVAYAVYVTDTVEMAHTSKVFEL